MSNEKTNVLKSYDEVINSMRNATNYNDAYRNVKEIKEGNHSLGDETARKIIDVYQQYNGNSYRKKRY